MSNKKNKKFIIYAALTTLTYLLSINISIAQSIGAGGVSYSGNIDGFYVNASGDLELDYVFIDNTPQIKARWNWFKVNSVKYKGISFNAQNNQIDKSLFDYKKEGFWNNVTISQSIPTVNNWSKVSRDIYAGGAYTSFSFDVDIYKWKALSIEERSEKRKLWKNQISPSRITLNSIKGIVLDNIFRAIKAKVQEDEIKKTKVSELENEFKSLESSFNSSLNYIENNKTGLISLNKYYIKASGLLSKSKRIDEQITYKVNQLKEEIKEKLDSVKASLNAKKFDEDINSKDDISSENDNSVKSSNKESIYQKRQRAALEQQRIEKDYKEDYQKKADNILKQGEKRIQVMQNTLDTWNSTMDNISTEMQRRHEREDRLLEQKRQERLRKEKIERERRDREREIRRIEEKKREATIAFLQSVKDLNLSLHAEYSTMYVLLVSKTNDGQLKAFQAKLHKNEDGHFPYKQDLIRSLKSKRKLNNLQVHAFYNNLSDYNKSLNKLRYEATKNDVIFSVLKSYENELLQKSKSKTTKKTGFWDN